MDRINEITPNKNLSFNNLNQKKQKISEDEYCPQNISSKFKKNFFVISGCSGSGKSTLMNELSSRGYSIVHEAGRQIVKEQVYIDGDALPWKDWMKFIELTISRTMYQYNIRLEETVTVFFDRSIIDQISWNHIDADVPSRFMNAALKYRFNEIVFITPPWKEIYKNDNERKHSYEDALQSYDSLIKTYESFGHKIIYLPKTEVTDRADMVIKIIKTAMV